MITLQCKRCNHTWRKRTRKPKMCPACKSPYWNKEKIVFENKERKSVRMLNKVKEFYPELDYKIDTLIELILKKTRGENEI